MIFHSMKSPLIVALSLAVSLAAFSAEPLTPKDIPRETQLGSGPPTAGAKVAMATPSERSKLPTLWLIGDSTVRNGSKGDGSTGGQWG